MLELYGRTQGSGLLKIQVYELESIKIPDIRKIPIKTIAKLSKLGKRLSEKNKTRNKHESIVAKIDDLVFDFLNLKHILPQLLDSEKQLMQDRLNKKL